jgi:hypothetical protein
MYHGYSTCSVHNYCHKQRDPRWSVAFFGRFTPSGLTRTILYFQFALHIKNTLAGNRYTVT